MPDATLLAELHPGSLPLFGWTLVTKVHRIRVLRLLHHPFIFPANFLELLHPLKKLLFRAVL